MCIAIYKPAGKELSKELLHTCYTNNPDGCGFAYVNVDIFGFHRIKYYKSMVFEKFYEKYKRATRISQYSPFIIHFRIGTHGEKTVFNCHPFMIDKETIFCHNGIISGVGFDKKLSDTQLFNNTILKQLPKGWMNNPAILQLLEEFIGQSKLIVLSLDNTVKILNEKKGEWFEGCWMSNSTYKTKVSYQYPSYKGYMLPSNTKKTYTINSWINCDYCDRQHQIKHMEIYKFSDQDVQAYCSRCFSILKEDPELKAQKSLSPFETLRILNTFGREDLEIPKESSFMM